MASSSGTTTTTTTTSATSSEVGQGEGELQARIMEQKKRRRMQSNRESARRSRMRKQQHADGLAEQAAALRAENARLLAALNLAARSCAAVDAENAVLRTQLLELSSRLGSLNEILLHCIDSYDQQQPLYVNQNNSNSNNNNNNFLMSSNSWNSNLGCIMMNQQHPIMASADMLHYYY